MARPDLRQYAFSCFDDFLPWIKEDADRLWNFQKRVEARLDKIPPGGMFEVLKHIRPEHYDLFTKIAGYYMVKEFKDKGLMASRTYFYDDNYTIIARLDIPPAEELKSVSKTWKGKHGYE